MWRLFQEKSRGSGADFINILEAAEDMSSTVFIRRSSVLGEYSLGGALSLFRKMAHFIWK